MAQAFDMESYQKGYARGYRAGATDALSGKIAGAQETLALPLEALGLSTRARNCLTFQGCETVGDVAALPEQTILRMRNLGRKTAGEIALALRALCLPLTDWDPFLPK